MYRDSQHGLTIDLSGPDGNAFFLMGQAQKYARQMDKDPKAILDEMMSGDYEKVLEVFEREFGTVVTLLNKPESSAALDGAPDGEVRHDPQPGDDEPLIDGPDEPFFNDPDYASGGDS